MSTTPPSPPRRRKRWLLLPLVLMLLIIGGAAWTWFRGTWATEQAIDPTTPGAPVVQLYRLPDGKPCIRAAILLPYPREQVWAAVTDYPHYDQFLPYLNDIQATPEKDGCHMTGDARSAVSGYWPFAIDIREQKGEKNWSAGWDQAPGEEIRVNRGTWTLSERGKQTLLVLTLEAEVKGYPTFLLRNVFLHRLPLVLQAVEARLQKDANR